MRHCGTAREGWGCEGVLGMLYGVSRRKICRCLRPDDVDVDVATYRRKKSSRRRRKLEVGDRAD